MKLQEKNSGAGFYESFSDIIFATMAIFILLMTIFLVLAQESSAARKVQKKLEKIQEQTKTVSQQIVEINKKSKLLESELKNLSKRNVEIAIAVDKTGSMEDELYNLKHAINQLSRILPKIMDNVRISIVAYRMSEYDSDDTAFFPMTQIFDTKKDGGDSLRHLSSWMSRQRHKGGSAPVLKATRRALNQFSQDAGERDHQVFMLLGDVGPYEITYKTPDRLTPEGQRRAEKLVSTVKDWIKSKNNRNMIILFSGRDEINDGRYGQDRRHKHYMSMKLFKEIANAAGQPDAYTENQSRMLVDFLVAALKRK